MKKQRHKKKITIAVCLLLTAGFICYLFTGRALSFRPMDQYRQSVPAIIAKTDADKDGIDDQTDTLLSALAYVSARPKYRSKYYANGYPDDEYGTCVDVIGFALKGAGYDLQNLVDQDVKEHPDLYQIDVIDRNIDFRRVKNLRIFFQNHAASLTTDPTDFAQWQGGDIVVFENHIGIVSDRRNKDGIPYVIHHGGSFQLTYEENILPKRTDITGHFRFPG